MKIPRLSLGCVLFLCTWAICASTEKDGSAPSINAPTIIAIKSKVSRANSFGKSVDQMLTKKSSSKPMMMGLHSALQHTASMNDIPTSPATTTTTTTTSTTTTEPTTTTSTTTTTTARSTEPPETTTTERVTTQETTTSTERPTEMMHKTMEIATEEVTTESTMEHQGEIMHADGEIMHADKEFMHADSEVSTTTPSTTTQKITSTTMEAESTTTLWTALFSLLEAQADVSTERSTPKPTKEDSKLDMGELMTFLQTLSMPDPDNTTPDTGEVSPPGEVEHHARFLRDVSADDDTEEGSHIEYVDDDHEQEHDGMSDDQDDASEGEMNSSDHAPDPFLARLANVEDDHVISFDSDTSPSPLSSNKHKGLSEAAGLARIPLFFQGAGSKLSREPPLVVASAVPNLSISAADLPALLASMLAGIHPPPNLLLPSMSIVNHTKPSKGKKQMTTSQNVQKDEVEVRSPAPPMAVNPLNTLYGKSYQPGKVSPTLKHVEKANEKELDPAGSSPEKVSAKKPDDQDYEYEYVYYYYDEDDPANKTTVVKPASPQKLRPDLIVGSATPSSAKISPASLQDLPEGRAIPSGNRGKGSRFEDLPHEDPTRLNNPLNSNTQFATPMPSSVMPKPPFVSGPGSPVLFLGIQREPLPANAAGASVTPTDTDPSLLSLYAFSQALPSTFRPPGYSWPGFAPSLSDSENGIRLHEAVFDPLPNGTDEWNSNDTSSAMLREDSEFASKPTLPKQKSTTAKTTTTEATTTTTTTTTAASTKASRRRPNRVRNTTTAPRGASSGGRKNSRRNKSTTAAPEDEENNTTTEKSTRVRGRNGSRKNSSKSRSTTTTTTLRPSTNGRRNSTNSRRKNSNSTRSRPKSRTTTASPETTTAGEGAPKPTPLPKRKSNLFPRRKGPLTHVTTTQLPNEEEEVTEAEEDKTSSTSAPSSTKSTTKSTTTLATKATTHAPYEEEVTEAETEADTTTEAIVTRPPLIPRRPLRPALRARTTTAAPAEEDDS